MKYPNLFIVGAAKSGTTTIYSYLKRHPQIFMPEDELYKEPAFFSSIGKMNTKDYLKLFEGAKDKKIKYVGETSTAYLTDERSAKKIYEYNKDAKIIISLRNSVDRAYSLYNWMVQEGYEFSGTFRKALEREKLRKNKKIPNFFESEYYWNYLYYESGLYYKQVKRYLDLFSPQNIMVIIFEEMVKDAQKTFKEITDFLGIRYINIEIPKENPSRKVYLSLLSFFG